MSEDASELFEAAKGSAAADPGSLQRLNDLADEAVQLEQLAATMEDDLAAIKKSLNNLKTKVLPEIMAELGVENITRNGIKLSVHDFVSGSLPKEEDKRKAAIAWLEAHDGGGLIKTNIELVFGREFRDEATELVRSLTEQGHNPVVDEGVHSSTLQSYARERLKSGAEIDTELLGLYTGTTVKITLPKSKKVSEK